MKKRGRWNEIRKDQDNKQEQDVGEREGRRSSVWVLRVYQVFFFFFFIDLFHFNFSCSLSLAAQSCHFLTHCQAPGCDTISVAAAQMRPRASNCLDVAKGEGNRLERKGQKEKRVRKKKELQINSRVAQLTETSDLLLFSFTLHFMIFLIFPCPSFLCFPPHGFAIVECVSPDETAIRTALFIFGMRSRRVPRLTVRFSSYGEV